MNRKLLDSWTVAHVLTGIVSNRLGVSFPIYLALSVAYEAVEYLHESQSSLSVFGTKEAESLGNVTSDLVMGILGYYASEMVKRGISGK